MTMVVTFALPSNCLLGDLVVLGGEGYAGARRCCR